MTNPFSCSSPLGNLQAVPLSLDVKAGIIRALWEGAPQVRLSGIDEGSFGPYFAHYTQECNLALHDCGRHVSARKHEDIARVVELLRARLDRQAIFEQLQVELGGLAPENEGNMINGTIDLVARIFLMMSFGDLPHAFAGPNRLSWKEGTIQECLRQYLEIPRALNPENVKLEKLFNARNLGRVAGIQIKWTSNLAEHLCMIDDDERVAIFHHASFLKLHQKRQEYCLAVPPKIFNRTQTYHFFSDIFPAGFVEETLSTLALLFPQSDTGIKSWIRKLPPSIDKNVRCCGHLRAEARQIENFKFWHDRLVILKGVFDEAEPKSLSQWWYDRRKHVQWYTFWVAILVLLLTIFFGIVQSIEGGLQAYKAFVPAP